MDAFGDDFGETPPEDVSAAFSDDPAADFLAREQEELGDLGEELGLSNGDSRPNIHTEDVDFFQGGDALADTGDAGMADDFGLGVSEPRSNATPSPQLFLNHPKPKEEPETIRKWREDYARLLQEKDQRETVQMEDLRNQAKKELSDWYKQYDDQLSKTKASNRETEKVFVAEVNDITPGSEWERVSKLCDFNAKTTKHSKDMSRMRSIMLQLKQSPPVKNAS